jgi:hypothetical protein
MMGLQRSSLVRLNIDGRWGVALLSAALSCGVTATTDPWRVVESVLTHPRCLNCHTTSDYPRQGDDRHVHRFKVSRGHDGKGAASALCSTCHQAVNQASSGVPGASGWRLAPPSMAWERRPGVALTGGSLCRRLLDRSRNGGLDLAALEHHLASEPLVLWAWAPGTRADGSERLSPPATREAFAAAVHGWLAEGAPCPVAEMSGQR